MTRVLLVLIALSFAAADASACDGPFARLRQRVQARRGVATCQQSAAVAFPAAPASACPGGVCPAAVTYQFQPAGSPQYGQPLQSCPNGRCPAAR